VKLVPNSISFTIATHNSMGICTVFVYYCVEIMTLRQRYKSLNNPHSVKEMIVTSVYNTMRMEGQPVSKERVENLYNQVKKEKQENRKIIPKKLNRL
jgi:hypothetical protein